MKAIKNVCAESINVQVKKLICIIVILSGFTFMSSCTAEELPLNQEEEVINLQADGETPGDPPVIIGTTYQPPKK